MKYIDEYRDQQSIQKYSRLIHQTCRHAWSIMEICGGQTHTIVKYGIEQLLPSQITLLHGPGCPVCVTPLEIIDKSISLASQRDIIFTSFGDMLRVPGSVKDLLMVKAEGGDIRIVYSPLTAVKIAQENPNKKVVFLAVGFETTAPANAMALRQAKILGLKNFFVLCSHVLVPPAIEALLSNPSNTIQAFLAAGHVCTIMGYEEYIPIAERYKIPIIVTGFEPLDILQGIYLAVKQLEEGKHTVENQYLRSVKSSGNRQAQDLIREVFRVTERKWRGIGTIPQSGLTLSEEYEAFDAERYFHLDGIETEESTDCISGAVLQGNKKPADCPKFRNGCTPEHPLGAPMVSSEGVCATYYRYAPVTFEKTERV
ncbi:MAG: hydrogenase formation protein HypD [Bacteroidota bacterium]